MKKIVTIVILFLGLNSFSQIPVLNIGDVLPKKDLAMQSATNGEKYTLEKLKGENGLLVIFACNTCPFVLAWEDRFPVVNTLAKSNKVGFALVNSNYMKRGGDDSFDEMKKHAINSKYQWAYLLDDESVVANAFGAQTTPHVFLFDKNLKLVYKGAIDDNYKDSSAVKEFWLKDALNSLGEGKEIALKETRNLGCGIKRKVD
jgi:hypothetical protein